MKMDPSFPFCANISKSLDPSFGIPTDVTFQILTSGKEVKAHKYVLALASPVFKKQFFGDAKETEDVIPVKETTEESFKTRIDFTYGKEIDWKEMTIEDLFDVANMAEKYLIEALMKEVQKIFEDVDITVEDAVTVAATAEEFNQFEDISKALLLHCAKFLKSVLKTQDDFVKFAAKYANTEMSQTALSLISKFPEVSPAEKKCGKCGKDCRQGKAVLSSDHIAVGDRVLINDQGKWNYALQRTCRSGVITGKTNDKNIINVKLDDGSRAGYYVLHFAVPVFLYDSC
eukprot:GFUD01034638.1.p1 GENE.GFUD01034638.1~~GFUD01034638.1.p1  ORF type:complete len:287 (+),score=70.32 GFUD01034638.1:51-911(+)